MRVAVVTVSDSVAAGARADLSGTALHERCRQFGWQVIASETLSDDRAPLEACLSALADSGSVDLILTTGGTGIGPRDTTPEATLGVCEKTIPGLAERLRARGQEKNPRAALSRAVAGVRGGAVIVNLPGSPKGAVESLETIAELLPHAVEVLHGARHD